MTKAQVIPEVFALRAIIENLDDAVITHDLDHIILNFNPAAEHMLGLNAEQLYGYDIRKLIPEELHAEHETIFNKLLEGEKIANYRTLRQSADHRVFPVSLTVSPVRDESGDVIGASHILRDITAEKEAEVKHSILSAIIEDSEDAIISKDLNGVITSWNKGAEAIFGYLPEEIIGKHITVLIPGERIHEEDTILESIHHGDKIEHFETIRMGKSGSLIPISLTVSPVRDKQGEIVGISKIARNINHKKLAEERQAILAAIVENSDDAIISKTLQGIITSWNKGAERIFGYKEQEVIGKHISIIIPPERMSEETNIINQLKAGNTLDHFQTIRVGKSGNPIHISLTVSPVKDSAGNIIGASKIARDITREKEAEATIKQLSRKKDEFIAMASHELKTPLTSMNGYLQLLGKRVIESNRPFLDKTIRQLDKLNALVNDLFDISKIQAGKLQLTFEEFDLSLLVREILDPIMESNPTYQFHTELDDEVYMEGDRMRIEQVVTNLVVNAIKYSPEGSTVKIVLKRAGDELRFVVEDQGIGIHPEHLPHIFSQFFRVQGPDKKISGLGLGLFITKEIIERHDGKIWAESDLGKGSRFFFTLPLKQNSGKTAFLAI